jgi:hypothetical protein
MIVSPWQRRQKCLLVYFNDYRLDPQAHGYTAVAFHLESIQVSLFIFSHRMAWCKRVH